MNKSQNKPLSRTLHVSLNNVLNVMSPLKSASMLLYKASIPSWLDLEAEETTGLTQ